MEKTAVVAKVGLAALVIQCMLPAACDHDPGPKEMDAAMPDARADRMQAADAAFDARADGGMVVIQHDYCDEPFYMLPNRGTPDMQALGGAGGTGWHWVVQSIGLKGESLYPIYFFDVDTCTEYHPLPDMDYASLSAIDHDSIVFEAAINNNFHTDLYYLDMSTWELTQVTDTTEDSETIPAFNGRYLAYDLWGWRDNQPTDKGFFLQDMETGDTTMLAPPGSDVGQAVMSERYLFWIGYSNDPRSYGKDVFYYDFETQQTVHVEASLDGWQYAVVTWGDYVVWDESDERTTPPYRLVLYHLPTGQRSVVTTEPILISNAMDKGLVVYSTARYDPAHASTYHKDTEIYEIATGLTRRLTTKASSLGVGLFTFNRTWPYLFFSSLLPVDEDTPPSLFAANLVALGVTDDQGNLLAGDPVIEPMGP